MKHETPLFYYRMSCGRLWLIRPASHGAKAENNAKILLQKADQLKKRPLRLI